MKVSRRQTGTMNNQVLDAEVEATTPCNLAPLLVFADDWGRHPSSCQHLIRQLLPRRSVTWVNTIMRPPRLSLATLRRAWEKSKQWSQSQESSDTAPSNPRVLNPRMWPWFASRLDRRLNRWLLSRQLAPVIRTLPTPPIVITTLPIIADLIGELAVKRWVYYCVDDFSVWPGLDGAALRRLEAQLVQKVDAVIAVSETLQDKMNSMGRPARLLTHGIDREFWSIGTSPKSPSVIDSLQPPFIVFWGVVDPRMDFEFISRLSKELSGGTIVFAGPLDNPDSRLLRLNRIVHVGSLPYEQLPSLAKAASVLIMPYADLEVTRAIQPLKLKEYLATGKPVVARTLPATRSWGDCLDLVDTPGEFSEAVRQRIATGLTDDQKAARSRLATESWAAKARDFENWTYGRLHLDSRL